MTCPDLSRTPVFELPEAFGLRWYHPGDEQHWIAVHDLADLYNRTDATVFREQFGEAEEALPERQCYLVSPNGRFVGTATAWFGEFPEGTPRGRVHWVAIVPEFQGRGLAKPLLSTVCSRLRELGCESAYLTTDTARIPALNLYWLFGFVPNLDTRKDRGAWQRLAASPDRFVQLKPALQTWLNQYL